jgi:hypothetical protein
MELRADRSRLAAAPTGYARNQDDRRDANFSRKRLSS